MLIRPGTANDVPAVLPMVEKLCALHESWDSAKYGFMPGVAQMYRGWLTQRARDVGSVFLVAEREDMPAEAGTPTNGVIVGFLVGTVEREIPIYRLSEFGFIHDLWVEPEYRNEGVGRQLTMLAIEKFSAMGVSQIRLDTAIANEPARKLFAMCGFRPSVTEMLLTLPPKMD